MTTGALLNMALVLGLASACFALVIRRAETTLPDPGDIHLRTGLMHMMVGIIAWTALVSLLVVATFATGLILPVATLILFALAQRQRYGTRLFSVYRSQIPLAVAALLIAIVAWLAVISQMQMDPSEIR